MALTISDRVKETTTTTGTGAITLAGAASGFVSFSVVGNSNTTYYAIVGQNSTEWEVGLGTYTLATTSLSRDTVISSSNSGSLVNFSAGAKDVFVTLPANRIIFQTASAINLPAGSSGVNISNGGTVTAITRTAGGSGYGTAPTVTISAPTTAGGVQATATCTVTAGAVDTSFTITNAGSGYVEQPTVSFSGGGGSGAAAYAKVGTDVSIKSSLNGVTNFIGIGGATALQIYDAGGSSGASGSTWKIGSNFSSSGALLFSTHEANFSSGGSNALRFYTNTVAQEQMRVSHTASAVNYVQVTGATTASKVVAISAQGSDADVTLSLSPKGAGTIRFGTYTGTILTPTGYITITDSGGTSRRLLVG